ncbi:uncharacterized protein Z519_04467 [Cladophialophora bantiana CBS 173.52]|uniref:Uncharacterized protein n=1 Tax=Cladophialophora bantiana (strain ATCC 10958 / CBS 173.52 / CDC B-1940 / NIH 8579) TaxID=1442370 RepID=A0A0D2EX78_CLAB1|nr:uncharacterized protein Z519_04467 [Cladophialophora bantiana CBS 173.52]KIW94491.1 hypothetical protein Z519_04467 [Cladophialophora bantiana CBS 173.52]
MAEVTTKKRGRPAKKQSPGSEVNLHHDSTDVGDIVPLPTTRSKASLASTTTTTTPIEEVAEACTGEKTKASASAKRKTPVIKKTPDSATPSVLKTRKPQAKPKSLASPHELSAPVPEGRKKAKAAPKKAGASSEESKTRLAQEKQPTTATATTPTAELVYPRQSMSKILDQAKAFSRQSEQLQLDLVQLVGQKEAAYAQCLSSQHVQPDTKATPTPTLQAFSDVDTLRIPADVSSSMAPLRRGTASTAPRPAPCLNANPTLTSESAHAFSTQTVVSLSQQQQQQQQPPHSHPHPPSSLLSSPIGPSQNPQHQVRPYSSTKALPMSTTIALAARQHNATGQSFGSKPSMPPRPTIPPEVPRGPKLSELPLEQLKKDPRYRKASTRYTTFVVALPFAIVTSYFLWERYREHQAYLKVRDARAKGQDPGTEGPASTPAPGQHDRE